MKRNLIILTGIVLLNTVLAAGGCSQSTKQEDSNTVKIFLKDTLKDGRVHLEMYNENDTRKKVIDNLVTEVQRGSTVKFKKADGSNVKKVLSIRPAVGFGNVFSEGESEDIDDLFLIAIDSAAQSGIIKYEIIFTVKKTTKETTKESTWYIDPYLIIPDN